ncbi:hypothetical protein D3C85_1196360 [compost metagenome]
MLTCCAMACSPLLAKPRKASRYSANAALASSSARRRSPSSCEFRLPSALASSLTRLTQSSRYRFCGSREKYSSLSRRLAKRSRNATASSNCCIDCAWGSWCCSRLRLISSNWSRNTSLNRCPVVSASTCMRSLARIAWWRASA